MTITAILAVDQQFGIGKKNGLPWPTNHKDMKWFSDNTRGHVVVMGYNTWDSLGGVSLPNRINVVVTSRQVEGADHVIRGEMDHILTNIRKLYPHLHIFIIGGANIYEQAFPYCDRVMLTSINGTYDCDTFIDPDGGIKEFTSVDVEYEDENITIQILTREE